LPPFYLVFDVESVGLHGDGYAVGFVVVDAAGKEKAAGGWAVNPRLVRGTPDGLAWARDNAWYGCGTDWGWGLFAIDSARDVRDRFWAAWEYWKGQGAVLAADVPWPVEAHFLSECVADRPQEREWQGPYPLLDVASVRLAAGLDPLATVDRLPSELPAHDPLADSRQSARLLIEALTLVRASVGANR
jgi:hypothetical protein